MSKILFPSGEHGEPVGGARGAAIDLLDNAPCWWDAASGTSLGMSNRGAAGYALDAVFGASGAADGADAILLPHVGETYVHLPGTLGNYLSIADSVELSITGDIGLFVDAVVPAGINTNLIVKWTTGQQSYVFRYDNGGTLSLFTSVDGSASLQSSSTATVAGGGRVKLGVTLDVDNGAGGRTYRFWTSNDFVTWTQLGTDVVVAGTTTIFDSTAIVELGSFGTGISGVSQLFRARVCNSTATDGTGTVLDFTPSGSAGATAMTAATGQTVTPNRNTAAVHKTTIVTATSARYATDDFSTSPASSNHDPGAGDFTGLWIGRIWGNPAVNDMLLSHRDTGGSFPGWYLAVLNTTPTLYFNITDGTTAASVAGPAFTYGQLLVVAGVVNRGSGKVSIYQNGVLTDTTPAMPGPVTSTSPLVFCRDVFAGTSHLNCEFRAAATAKYAMTKPQLDAIWAYYKEIWP